MTVWATAAEIASSVVDRQLRASEVVEAALARIAVGNSVLNAFTSVTAERARARAAAIDAALDRGEGVGPLAGVPFAVKNLFDVAGLATLAGSRINADHAPAATDALLVRRLEAAGAVLVGALNMGEYAYDFTGENAHAGPSRNPHDPARMSGGSSGGSGAAVAGGLVPIALGSDTNGSIRVPAAFCGVFGLKPTYGRLPRTGTFPFVASLDHLGPLARSVTDLALSYDAMQGPDEDDPACAARAIEPVLPALEAGTDGLRVAVLGGYFEQDAGPEALAAVQRLATALGARRHVALAGAATARAAAYIITTAEGASLHLRRLRTRPQDFDPDVRDRLIAGALVPAPMLMQAQKIRRAFAAEVAAVFRDVDLLLAPATPFPAPAIGQRTVMLGGREELLRPNIGIFTQPISFVGLPVVAVPVASPGELPVAVQLIAPAWREDLCLRAARVLERLGVALAPRPGADNAGNLSVF